MTNQEISKILPIIGAIAGDIIGSSYELIGSRTKDYNFDLFNNNSSYTDDTVLTIAVAKWLLNDSIPLQQIILSMGKRYMDVGFGHAFKEWLRSNNPKPYNSWGNGSTMRVSTVALKTYDLKTALLIAKETAIITHNHPEGIKGAQAVTSAIFLARNGFTKGNIKDYIENTFKYNLSRRIEDIRDTYSFDSSCQGSVPEAIIAFLQSSDFEDAIRLAVSLGGDADTQACITGAIAASFYNEMPSRISNYIFEKLPEEFTDILEEFCKSDISTKASVVLTTKENLYIDSYMKFTFALAVTDFTKVFIPKGTILLVDINARECSIVHIINNKEQIFSRIEKELQKKYPEATERHSYLCNGVLLKLCNGMYDKLYISEATEDDIF